MQWYEPTQQWLISRYADVSALLRDRRLGRSYLHVTDHAGFGQPPDLPGFGGLLARRPQRHARREPPDHTRLRRLVSRAFTPRTVERLRPRVQEITDGLVDELLDATSNGSSRGSARDRAGPLPVTVIAELLGIPGRIGTCCGRGRPTSAGCTSCSRRRRRHRWPSRAAREFSAYLVDLARSRRQLPGRGSDQRLVHVVDEGDRLTEDELVGTCVLLLNAGHEASVNGAGNGWWALFRHPDELARLRSDVDGLLGTAIEELLRFDTPPQMFERWVLEDIVVAGVEVSRGSEVALLLGSANHDPAVFDSPEQLDLGRQDNPHVTFGAGIHFCLGAPLARMELEVSYATLLRRSPGSPSRRSRAGSPAT